MRPQATLTRQLAVFPLFGTLMYDNLGFQWATTLLALLMTVMMPFPYLFYKYGKTLRNKVSLRVAVGGRMANPRRRKW